jgi:hypothetical protein
MRDQLQHAMSLARKTGDRLIVFDTAQSAAPYVVMPLSQYEQLVLGQGSVRDLTEDELLDRINRDIAIWQNEQQERPEPPKMAPQAVSRSRSFAGIDEIIAARPELPEGIFATEERNGPNRPKWTIPVERKEAAEEVIEEDRVYLEDL